MNWSRTIASSILFAAISLLATAPAGAQSAQEKPLPSQNSQAGTWKFAVSGDSRNCGDVVMPAIATGVRQTGAAFYWHLGDFRAIYDFDEDMQHQPEHREKPLTIAAYLQTAWDDFLQNQIAQFNPVPVFLGIGNHDTISPRTRDGFIIQFADWLDSPVLREQRLRDNPNDHKLRAYYHWIDRGIDFINLDNATDDQFDYYQVKWFEQVLQTASSDANIHTIVVGMHEALPDSISENHAMDQSAQGRDSGRRVYGDLLKAQNDAHKRVYVIASHSHYYMAGTFNTPYWREHGGVLPGWIVGTAGAVRYSLPPEKRDAQAAETNVYGFLTGTVKADGEIGFAFERLSESDVPPAIVERYTPQFVHWCFAENSYAH
ncbi:MAG TPA: metallophosphoesterase [Terriglobales bacterium]|nr:metallophosphoesterase [Terriglobales bacterium]